MAHLDRRRGFGVGGGRGVFGRGGSSLQLIFFSGAQLPFRVAGGAEGVEEAGGEIDFTGEEAARGFLATAIKIGHGKVLLELVHNNENLNETIGPTYGAGPELESRKDSYYASSRQQDRKKRATAGAMCACRDEKLSVK